MPARFRLRSGLGYKFKVTERLITTMSLPFTGYQEGEN
jgi:hypothetical protein